MDPHPHFFRNSTPPSRTLSPSPSILSSNQHHKGDDGVEDGAAQVRTGLRRRRYFFLRHHMCCKSSFHSNTRVAKKRRLKKKFVNITSVAKVFLQQEPRCKIFLQQDLCCKIFPQHNLYCKVEEPLNCVRSKCRRTRSSPLSLFILAIFSTEVYAVLAGRN